MSQTVTLPPSPLLVTAKTFIVEGGKRRDSENKDIPPPSQFIACGLGLSAFGGMLQMENARMNE